MHEQLIKLIKKAQAPLTSRKVGCILITKENKLYEGYNVEKEERILHAEDIAVSKARKDKEDFKIKEIHLMANGKPENVKRAIPCENCSKILQPHSQEDFKAVFYFFDDSKKTYSLNLSNIINAYTSFNEIPLISDSKRFDKYFKGYLTEIDQKFILEFVNQIKSMCNEIYLTGSACKRGSPKPLLAKEIMGKSYLDIDLITLFSNKNKEEVNKIIKKSILKSLNNIGFSFKELFEKDEISYILEEDPTSKDSEGFLFRKFYWAKGMQLTISPPDYKKNLLMPSSIDMSAGINLKETITKKYLDKKWLVRLL